MNTDAQHNSKMNGRPFLVYLVHRQSSITTLAYTRCIYPSEIDSATVEGLKANIFSNVL